MTRRKKRGVRASADANLVTNETGAEKRTGTTEQGREELSVSVPSLSGSLIQLEEEGRIDVLLQLLARREKQQRAVQSTRMQLSRFADPVWLLQSCVRILNNGMRFGPELRRQHRELQEREERQALELRDTEETISGIAPLMLTSPTWVAPLPVRLPGIDPDENPYVLVRDYFIKKISNEGLPDDEGICKRLDSELSRRDEPPMGIPEKWVLDYGEEWQKHYGWQFYWAAYRDKRTKNRMQAIISKAKLRIPS